jgi:hypothetical protein
MYWEPQRNHSDWSQLIMKEVWIESKSGLRRESLNGLELAIEFRLNWE